ncbi:sirohydrochlorin chelatase [Alteribacillus iranensis]|uniref:Sirohydrochlorin ferrochelatase n=1 Tax=Alteribacillus iranensis TaxID=930128 RepID=A0A1I1ZXK3_9BACI|nr:sirohydrochlorin chelatase [Alteribacillus iranensis]SFE36375.1 sirohydrochlorin ferrochelatase [Alteribacillus iranensis]
MSTAILYVGHGSRVKAGVEEAALFIDHVKRRINKPIQETCFLEFASPSIEEGIEKCAVQGATRIVIMPVLLLTAGHALYDIPSKIEKAKERYPAIEFSYGNTLGVHDKMAESVHDRIQEKNTDSLGNDMVLLIGRGSKNPSVKHDMEEIKRRLLDIYQYQHVELAFMYGVQPDIWQGFLKAKQSEYDRVLVLPYLLFSGVLLDTLKKKVEEFTSPAQAFVLCETLGYHPFIRDVLVERVDEAANKMSVQGTCPSF